MLAATAASIALVPRPAFGDGRVFVSIGYHSPPGLWAIRPDGTGDVSKTAVVWKQRKDVPSGRSHPRFPDRMNVFKRSYTSPAV